MGLPRSRENWFTPRRSRKPRRCSVSLYCRSERDVRHLPRLHVSFSLKTSKAASHCSTVPPRTPTLTSAPNADGWVGRSGGSTPGSPQLPGLTVRPWRPGAWPISPIAGSTSSIRGRPDYITVLANHSTWSSYSDIESAGIIRAQAWSTPIAFSPSTFSLIRSGEPMRFATICLERSRPV